MRSDMAKVLVERPRRGGWRRFRDRRCAFDRKTRTRADEPAHQLRMGMGFAADKSLNENLEPLRRFLLARRGCHWDRVYSEIRSRLAPRSTVDMHVMQHLWEFVLFARHERSGALVLVDRFGAARCELQANGQVIGDWGCGDTFYVCAKTRRLIYVPRVHRWRRLPASRR